MSNAVDVGVEQDPLDGHGVLDEVRLRSPPPHITDVDRSAHCSGNNGQHGETTSSQEKHQRHADLDGPQEASIAASRDIGHARSEGGGSSDEGHDDC